MNLYPQIEPVWILNQECCLNCADRQGTWCWMDFLWTANVLTYYLLSIEVSHLHWMNGPKHSQFPHCWYFHRKIPQHHQQKESSYPQVLIAMRLDTKKPFQLKYWDSKISQRTFWMTRNTRMSSKYESHTPTNKFSSPAPLFSWRRLNRIASSNTPFVLHLPFPPAI